MSNMSFAPVGNSVAVSTTVPLRYTAAINGLSLDGCHLLVVL